MEDNLIGNIGKAFALFLIFMYGLMVGVKNPQLSRYIEKGDSENLGVEIESARQNNPENIRLVDVLIENMQTHPKKWAVGVNDEGIGAGRYLNEQLTYAAIFPNRVQFGGGIIYYTPSQAKAINAWLREHYKPKKAQSFQTRIIKLIENENKVTLIGGGN